MAAAFGLASERPEQEPELFAEGFVAAQRMGQSSAAVALTQMAAREAQGNGAQHDLVRQRQDLEVSRQAVDKRLMDALAASERNAPVLQDLRAKLAQIARQIAAFDADLENQLTDYVALVSPQPLTADETAKLLRPEEVLVQFVFLGADVLALYVSKDSTRWLLLPASTETITAQVHKLRCGLDVSAWAGRGESDCQNALGSGFTAADAKKGKPLPFNLAVAHELYNLLFGVNGPQIRDKHVLVVPSGPLTTLPFQVLVTEPPAQESWFAFTGATDYGGAKWLGTQQPISILPSVASLKALRAPTSAAANASQSYLGFANPLLDGNPANPSQVKRAQEARARQHCPEPVQVGALEDDSDRSAGALQSNGLADLAQLRRWAPLPETANEVCEVARSLGVRDADRNTRLGARATESEVKALSADQQLKSYRIVHFATHGALGGQLNGAVEPGLILTPPDAATPADDGYLSASEIAELKLGADWIILSACNTAAAGVEKSEALSGLARAFFYAGARALLVSHWSVNSAATVALVTKAVDALAKTPGLGRARAMQVAMSDLVSKGAPFSHPTYWAPFVVVGEGGAGRQ